MSTAKIHTGSPEMRSISLTEYRANQETIGQQIDSVAAILQSLKHNSYQNKA